MELKEKARQELRLLGMVFALLAMVLLLQIAPKETLAVYVPREEYRMQKDMPALYILNRNTKVYHLPECVYASQIKERNRLEFTGTHSEITGMGYSACAICRP